MLNFARHLSGVAGAAGSGGGPAKAAFACNRLLLLPASGHGISSTCCSSIGSQMSDNDPEALKHHKEKALSGEMPTFVPEVDGWHETLASVSEAVVKAERYVDDNTTADPVKLEMLQKHTIEVVQQLHHRGEEGMPEMPKYREMDVSGSPAHAANLERTRNSHGTDPR